MKYLLKIALLAIMIIGLIPLTPAAQEGGQMKRGVGVATFYLSVKDKIGITKEQEEKLIAIEQNAIKKLGELRLAITKEQQLLVASTREDEIDLVKTRKLLNNLSSLESDVKFTRIEATALEKKVLTKEQREKANEIAQELSRGSRTPPGKK